jgi:hypothetical protein
MGGLAHAKAINKDDFYYINQIPSVPKNSISSFFSKLKNPDLTLQKMVQKMGNPQWV